MERDGGNEKTEAATTCMVVADAESTVGNPLPSILSDSFDCYPFFTPLCGRTGVVKNVCPT